MALKPVLRSFTVLAGAVVLAGCLNRPTLRPAPPTTTTTAPYDVACLSLDCPRLP